MQSDQTTGISVEVNSLDSTNEQEINETETGKQKEIEELKNIPPEFSEIDFKNFTYKSILENGKFKLKNGVFEKKVKTSNEYADQWENWRVNFGAVVFIDVNNDSKKEALVEISETQSAGSSYSAYGYKLFTLQDKKTRLIWEISTGSESNCGHKHFSIEKRKIILEVFGICKTPQMRSENYSGDFFADNFTRLVFSWNGKEMFEESREVLPYPEKEVHKHLYKNTLYNFIQH